MRAGRTFAGYRRVIPVKRGVVANATGQTQILMDDLPAKTDGRDYSIIKFFLRYPEMKLTIPIANAFGLDELSVLQMMGRTQIKMSPTAPPANEAMGGVICPEFDAPRLGMLQSFLTGENMVSVTAGDISTMNSPPASNATNGAGFEVYLEHKECGSQAGRPPQFLGPFGASNGFAAQDITFRPVQVINLVADGERWEVGSSPSRWWSGRACGCAQSTPGEIDATPGTLSDSFAVALTGSNQVFDLFALVYVHPSTVHPIPCSPYYMFYNVQNTDVLLRPGATMYAGFVKQLDPTTGDMLDSSYQVVKLIQAGMEVQWDQTDDQNRYLPHDVNRKGQRWSTIQSTITGYTKGVRLTRFGQPIITSDSGILTAFGMLQEGLILRVIQTAETDSHHVVSAHLTPNTPKVTMSALEWAGLPPSKYAVIPQTRTGKPVDPERAMALPMQAVQKA